jgi:hypothetical protein
VDVAQSFGAAEYGDDDFNGEGDNGWEDITLENDI